MLFEKKTDEKGVVAFCFKAEKEEWTAAKETAAKDIQRKVKIDGFRQGKAPMSMIMKAYAQDVVSDGADVLFSKAYKNEVMAELATLRIFDDLGLSVDNVTDDELEFKFEYILMPDFELKKYTGLSIKKAVAKVSDEDVDNAIKSDLAKQGRWIDVDRAAEMGDTVNIDFDGFVDDVRFEGGEAKEFDLELGSGRFIPGFEEQLVGMKKDEEKDIFVTFPEEYGMEQLNGKQARFAIKLHSVKYKELPAVDNDFALDLGYDSLDAYKAEIKGKLMAQATAQAEAQTENNMFDALLEANPIEVSDFMIEHELEKDLASQNERYKQYNMSFEQVLQMYGSDLEKYKEERKTSIKANIQTRLIFTAVLEKEKVDVTKEEVEAEIEKIAQSKGQSVEDYKKEMSHEDVHRCENMAITYKLLDFFKANNSFIEE